MIGLREILILAGVLLVAILAAVVWVRRRS